MTKAGIVFWILVVFWLVVLPQIIGRLNWGFVAIIIDVIGINLTVLIGSVLLLNPGRGTVNRSVKVIPIEIEYVFRRR